MSLAAITISLAGLFSAPVAHAQDDHTESAPDVVILKDGTILRGTIVKELSGYVWIDVGGEEEKFLSPGEIESFTRTSAPEPTQKNQQDQTLVGEPEQWERVPGVMRAAVLTAEGMIGMQFTAKPLREAIPMLKAEGIDLVVLKVNSGGGLRSEMQAISDVLHDEYKPEFALVGWVGSAISAAAFTSLTFEELYFMPKGNLGVASHIWHTGPRLQTQEQLDKQIELFAERGGKNPFLAKALVYYVPLSYDVDEETGEINLYQSLEGKHILNEGEGILVLNANTALECGFSNGTAKTIEELTTLLKPEHGKIVWVGEEVEGVPYPVSKAERHQREYRKEVDYADARLGEVISKYRMELGNAQSVGVNQRGGFLKRAESYLAQIKRIVVKNPNLGVIQNITDDWFAQQKEVIASLRDE